MPLMHIRHFYVFLSDVEVSVTYVYIRLEISILFKIIEKTLCRSNLVYGGFLTKASILSASKAVKVAYLLSFSY